MEIIKPNIELKPYIKAFWSLSVNHTEDKCMIQRIIPSGLVELTFFFNSFPEYQRQGKSYRANAVLNGQHTDFYEIRIPKTLDMLSVLFTPLGASIFFDFPMDEIKNQNVPVDLLDKKPGKAILAKLHDAVAFRDRASILEAYFMKRLTEHDFWNIKRLVSGINTLSSSGGIVPITELADKACLSTKQFKRVFQEVIGTTPKAYSRILRMQKTLYTYQNQPESLTTLAYTCGYSDQAHMVHEFKSLTGYTPKQYFSVCTPYSDFYAM